MDLFDFIPPSGPRRWLCIIGIIIFVPLAVSVFYPVVCDVVTIGQACVRGDINVFEAGLLVLAVVSADCRLDMNEFCNFSLLRAKVLGVHTAPDSAQGIRTPCS